MTKGTDLSGMMVWVTPGKDPRPVEVLAEGGRNTECIVEEGSSKYQLRSCDQLQKQIINDMNVPVIFRILYNIFITNVYIY